MKKMLNNATTRIHPEMERSFDDQFDQDRDWFLKHPLASKYYRKSFEIENAQGLQLCGKVPRKILVTKIWHGLRTRNFLF